MLSCRASVTSGVPKRPWLRLGSAPPSSSRRSSGASVSGSKRGLPSSTCSVVAPSGVTADASAPSSSSRPAIWARIPGLFDSAACSRVDPLRSTARASSGRYSARKSSRPRRRARKNRSGTVVSSRRASGSDRRDGTRRQGAPGDDGPPPAARVAGRRARSDVDVAGGLLERGRRDLVVGAERVPQRRDDVADLLAGGVPLGLHGGVLVGDAVGLVDGHRGLHVAVAAAERGLEQTGDRLEARLDLLRGADVVVVATVVVAVHRRCPFRSSGQTRGANLEASAASNEAPPSAEVCASAPSSAAVTNAWFWPAIDPVIPTSALLSVVEISSVRLLNRLNAARAGPLNFFSSGSAAATRSRTSCPRSSDSVTVFLPSTDSASASIENFVFIPDPFHTRLVRSSR